jgi:hypothetical protein
MPGHSTRANDKGYNSSRPRPAHGAADACGAAKRATIASMSWHQVPNDDAWKQAHLAMLARLLRSREGW